MGIPIETLKAWAAAADCSCVSRDAINAQLRRGATAVVAPVPAVRGLVGGDGLASVVILGLRIVNPLNGYGRGMHWRLKQKLKRHQADMVAVFVGRVLLPAPPVRVRLVRVHRKGRAMDPDGLAAAFKAIQDAVARLLGVDDGDGTAARWKYEQEQGEAAAVRIEAAPVRDSGN